MGVKCPKKGKFYAVKSRDGNVHLFETDHKHYWKIMLSAILAPQLGGGGRARVNSFSKNRDSKFLFKIGSKDSVGVDDDVDGDEKEQKMEGSGSPKPDWEHRVIELHTENKKLEKELKHSKSKIDALIQQNIKLNHQMRDMEIEHLKEVRALKSQLQKIESQID